MRLERGQSILLVCLFGGGRREPALKKQMK